MSVAQLAKPILLMLSLVPIRHSSSTKIILSKNWLIFQNQQFVDAYFSYRGGLLIWRKGGYQIIIEWWSIPNHLIKTYQYTHFGPVSSSSSSRCCSDYDRRPNSTYRSISPGRPSRTPTDGHRCWVWRTFSHKPLCCLWGSASLFLRRILWLAHGCGLT